MWELSYKNAQGNRVISVETQFGYANAVAKQLVQDGFQEVRLKKKATDVWIADPKTASIILVNSKMHPVAAARWAREWVKTSRDCGCLLWPHGRKMPESWKTAKTIE